MMGLLVFKEQLKKIYVKYSFFIIPIMKFLYSLITFLVINHNIGFMIKLKNPFVPLLLALVCSFLPYSAISFVAAIYMLVHLNAVSFEVTLISCIFLLVIALLYYSFRPGDSFLLVLTPVMFFLKIPYVIPLVVGLSCSMISIIPVSSGVFIYYLLLYVKQNAGVLTGDASIDITQKYVQIIKTIASNKLMIVMIAAFAVAVLLVTIIKNLSVDYAWSIAVIAGTVSQLIVIFMGDFIFNVSVTVIQLILGVLISVILAAVYVFFVFSVDYSRTEYTQFEDDDYYYYVKAVPKMTVSAPDVKVQRINTRKN